MIDNMKADRVRKVADLANRRTRERFGRFLIEGPQSVREAVTWMPDAVRDLYVQAADGPDGPRIAGETLTSIVERSQEHRIYVHPASEAVMRRISRLPGIAAVGDADAVRATAQGTQLPEEPFVAAFWQVRDPGNAGTVIRAADAAGCDAVVFVDDCVDMLNPKVIRATAGSLFHIPVMTMGVDEFFGWAGEKVLRTVAADVYGTDGREPRELPEALRDQDLSGVGKAVIFGNEARGLEPGLLGRCDDIVRIPLYGKAESLNLATSAAIMLMSMAMSSHIGTM